MVVAAAQTFDDAGFAVSAEGYDELAGVLRNSGCGRTFSGNGYLDMNNRAIEHGAPSKDAKENLGADVGEKIAGAMRVVIPYKEKSLQNL